MLTYNDEQILFLSYLLSCFANSPTLNGTDDQLLLMEESSGGSSASKVRLLTEEALTWMTSGDSQRAFGFYQDAFRLSVEAGNLRQILACACNYGASCLVNQRTDEAIDLLEEYLKQVQTSSDREDENFFTLIGDVHYNLALAYNVKADYKLAISHFKSASRIFETHGAEEPLAETHQQLGDTHRNYSEHSEAANSYKLAAKLFGGLHDLMSEAKMYIKIAKLHLDNKDRNGCLNNLRKCEQVCETVVKNCSNTDTLTRLTFNLAMTFKKLKERDKALRWLQFAEGTIPATTPSNADVKLHALITQSQGKMYMETRDYMKAVGKYQQAAAYFGQLGDRRSRAWCFYHLGGIFLLLKDSRNAERNYLVASQILEDTGKVGHLWKVKEGLGDLSASTYQYPAAVTYYREALTLVGVHQPRASSRDDQGRIVDKLKAVLNSQWNGRREDTHVSYSRRIPVVLPMSMGSSLDYSKGNILGSTTHGTAAINGPATVTGPDILPQKPNEGKKSKDRKHKSKKRGNKREMAHKPVPNGVSEYESDSDLARMEREMLKQLTITLERTNSLPQNLGNTYESLGGGCSLKRTASQERSLRRYSHDIQSLPGNSMRQTPSNSTMEEERRKSWRFFGKRQSSMSNSSSSGSSEPGSRQSGLSLSETETDSINRSMTGTIPLYATIDKQRKNFSTNSINNGASTSDYMSCTIPSRMAPDPPDQCPPTLPPLENHPLLMLRGNHVSPYPTTDEDSTIPSDYMSSTIPSRTAPDPPDEGPPTLPPMEHHPLVTRGDHSLYPTTDEDSTIPSQWTPNDPPALPPIDSHSLVTDRHQRGSSASVGAPNTSNGGQRIENPYEVAAADTMSWQGPEPAPPLYRKTGNGRRKSDVQRSRMCVLM